MKTTLLRFDLKASPTIFHFGLFLCGGCGCVVQADETKHSPFSFIAVFRNTRVIIVNVQLLFLSIWLNETNPAQHVPALSGVLTPKFMPLFATKCSIVWIRPLTAIT